MFIHSFKFTWFNAYLGLVLGLGERKLKTWLLSYVWDTHLIQERGLNMTGAITAPAMPEQTSGIAHSGTIRFFFFLFFQKSKSRFTPEKYQTSQNQSCSVLFKRQIEDRRRTRVKEERKNVRHCWGFLRRALIYPLQYCTISYHYRNRSATTEPLENLEGTGIEKIYHFRSRTWEEAAPRVPSIPSWHRRCKEALLSGAEWAWDSH